MNRRCFVLHAGFLLLLPMWLLMLRRDPVLFRLCIVLEALSLSIILPSFLTYWQGDRLVISALPAWAVLYVSVGHAMWAMLPGWRPDLRAALRPRKFK